MVEAEAERRSGDIDGRVARLQSWLDRHRKGPGRRGTCIRVLSDACSLANWRVTYDESTSPHPKRGYGSETGED